MCALLVYRTSHVTNHNAEYRLRVYFKTGRATSSLQINAGTHSSDAATSKFILIRRRDVNGELDYDTFVSPSGIHRVIENPYNDHVESNIKIVCLVDRFKNYDNKSI